MRVFEVESGSEHLLPADTVTRDTPQAVGPPRSDGGPSQGPILPLAFRPRDDTFYVTAARWPGLQGKALRVRGEASGRRAAAAGRRGTASPDGSAQVREASSPRGLGT